MKPLLLFAAALALKLPLFAATAPGYIVLENQDTIQAEIIINGYQGGSGFVPHPKKVFTAVGPEDRDKYTVESARAYGFQLKGEWFHFRRMPSKKDGRLRFVQMMFTGKNVTFYLYRSEIATGTFGPGTGSFAPGGGVVDSYLIEDNRVEGHPVFYYDDSQLTDDLKLDLKRFFGFSARLGKLLDEGMRKNHWNEKEMLTIFRKYNDEPAL